MIYNYTPPRSGAGPFGYTLGDLSSRTPEEHDEMGRELEEVENNLQWGFEPGRWADGAEYYRGAWPEAKLLGADAFAQSFDQRNELTAEAGEFKSMLGEAKKIWKTNAGLNSPLLPALASLPNQERERVRNQSKKFRELIAYGQTPDRWEWDINNLRDGGHLLDPEADTERLMRLWETKDDLLPHLDATDHALDLLGELDKEDAEANDSQPIRDALAAIGLPAGKAGADPATMPNRVAAWRRQGALYDPATIPQTREAVLRYGPGQEAPQQVTPAVYAPGQAFGDSATGGLLVPVRDAGTGDASNSSLPPVLNTPSPPPPPTPTPNVNTPFGVGAPNVRAEDAPDPSSRKTAPGAYPGNVKERAPGEFSRKEEAQLQRPFDKAGKFIDEQNLINGTVRQSELRSIAEMQQAARESGRQEDRHRSFAHLYGRPREQDEILNDPSHPYNVYENATPEERAALDKATYEQRRREAEQWVERRGRLAASEKKPDGPGPRALRSAGDQAAKEAGGEPGAKEVIGSAGVFEQTLKQHKIDPDDPDAIARATMNRNFQNDLNTNLEQYWIDVAKKAVVKAGKGAVGGVISGWLGR